VPRLQRVADPGGVAAFSRRLDAAQLAYKGDLFATHGLAARGREASAAERACVRDDASYASRGPSCARRSGSPTALPEREPARARDAAGTPPRDDRPPGRLARAAGVRPRVPAARFLRRAPEAEIARHFETTRRELPDADPEVAALRFALLGVARKGKDYARFLDVAARRGDPRGLVFLPTTWRHLRACAQAAAARDASFAELAELVATLPEPACAP
jgi:hypothetical protein